MLWVYLFLMWSAFWLEVLDVYLKPFGGLPTRARDHSLLRWCFIIRSLSHLTVYVLKNFRTIVARGVTQLQSFLAMNLVYHLEMSARES